jgi:hypothetical protein
MPVSSDCPKGLRLTGKEVLVADLDRTTAPLCLDPLGDVEAGPQARTATE